MFRVALAIVSFTLGSLVANVAAQEAAPAGVIVSVEFSGLRKTAEQEARAIAGVNPGDRIGAGDTQDDTLNQAVVRLLRSGRFLTADYKTTAVAGGVAVVFNVHERAIVRSIQFNGNDRIADKRLADLISQPVDSPVDWLAVRRGRDAIIEMYRDEGHGDVQVAFDQDGLEQTGDLVFTIREGKRDRIRAIEFEGNTSLTSRQLARQIDTKKAFWIFRSGAPDTDRLESDTARLRTFYRDEGFLDAQVAYRQELSDNGKDMTIVFTVDEGSRYTLESLEFEGNTVLSSAELESIAVSKVGETVRRREIDADVRAIRMRYGQLGHIYATTRPIRVFSNTPGNVRVVIQITEGDAYRVGRVIVQGNTRTRDKVVRRALNLYPPDDLFDLSEAKEAERRLMETRIFASARVYPIGDKPGVRDVMMDVAEAEKAGDFIFGAGVTSNSGIVGNIVLDLQNFDIRDRPRSWDELIKLKSFFGGGQRMRIELQPGGRVSRFRVEFTEPYLNDKPMRFDFSAFLFGRTRDGYDEARAGTNISIGKRFQRGKLRDWSGEVALRLENVTIRDVDVFASGEIRDDKGSNLLTSIKGSLARDRTDNRFLPTTGDVFRIGYEQVGILGGDHSFGKLTTSYVSYKTLHTDLLDRKHVLRLKAAGGVIIGDAPVFERFFAGGTGSIRGFDFRGVGERGGIDRNNIGGDFRILLGGEYSFPLFGENFRGLLFLDSGTAGVGAYRAAVGAGVRFTINFFGPVPLEFNLALPVSSDEEDDTQVFSFLIGRLF